MGGEETGLLRTGQSEEAGGRVGGAAQRQRGQRGQRGQRRSGGAEGRHGDGAASGGWSGPRRPHRPSYLVGLLLAHGQGQLELQLLLAAALRPRLLRLRWGPGAHSCRGGCGESRVSTAGGQGGKPAEGSRFQAGLWNPCVPSGLTVPPPKNPMGPRRQVSQGGQGSTDCWPGAQRADRPRLLTPPGLKVLPRWSSGPTLGAEAGEWGRCSPGTSWGLVEGWAPAAQTPGHGWE